MHRKIPMMILVGAALLAVLFAAGCTGNTGTEKTTTGQAVPVMVKNSGAEEIHAWIASDQKTWGGNHGNRISPGEHVILSYLPATWDAGSTTPAYVCVGMGEKILKCTNLAPSTTNVTWDGTTLIPGS